MAFEDALNTLRGVGIGHRALKIVDKTPIDGADDVVFTRICHDFMEVHIIRKQCLAVTVR